MMNCEKLVRLNQQGFVPGPNETEAAFFERAEAAISFFGRRDKEWIPSPHWNWVEGHLKNIFDFQPAFLPAFYSNESLAPWQGAACWIEAGQVKAVQLKEGLRKGTYLGVYSREEILSHEAVHAARSAFQESRFEEFFAYMTSPKKWRRVLGPILEKPWEVWPFLAGFLGGSLFQFAAVFSENLEKASAACYLGASLWAGAGFWRLIRRHLVLKRCASEVLKVVKEPQRARAVLLRLTDEEILQFAKFGKIKEYASRQQCLRWKLIRFAYFSAD